MLIVFLLCFEHTSSCRPKHEIYNTSKTDPKNNYFGNSHYWGGWDPPANDSSWKTWIAIWGTENSSNFDSTENGGGPESGWPQYWKGLGKGNDGVPPPPWSYVPLAYGKPQFCFLQPEIGECDKDLTRWGYNPTKNKCQTFEYGGCGGNDNNFLDMESCKAACVDVPSTGCETGAKINFEEMIYK
ncbi:papilin-like [Nymphalis io]|uniref:papilin-like n=1 Tax=Inachis io TaxID=171585 RepID=UPI002169EE72|nr:papilin-like [Nymphalis io]